LLTSSLLTRNLKPQSVIVGGIQDPTTQNSSAPSINRTSILFMDCTEVAKQITLIDFELHQKIRCHELLCTYWLKKDRHIKAKHVVAAIERFDQVAQSCQFTAHYEIGFKACYFRNIITGRCHYESSCTHSVDSNWNGIQLTCHITFLRILTGMSQNEQLSRNTCNSK
jgi:hypothetical protein